MNEQCRRHQAELRKVRAGAVQASRRMDEETMRELEEGAKRLQERMEEIAKDSEEISSNYAEEKRV